MKKLLILSLLILSFSFIKSQNEEIFNVSGIVIDKTTNQPIAFANIGVEGTFFGVASDINGKFILNIPSKYKETKIVISAVGYSLFQSFVSECAKDSPLEVFLTPKLYKIDEVEISAESLVTEKLVKDAIDNISKNYIQQAYSYEVFYKCVKTQGEKEIHSREAFLKTYSGIGYTRKTIAETYKGVNYKFYQSRREKDNNSLKDGLTEVDNLLQLDVVGNTRNILDKYKLHVYELKSLGEIKYQGKSLAVVGFSSKSPKLSNCGFAFVTRYSGKIYINKDDFAILKCELIVETSSYSDLGISYLTKTKDKEIIKTEYNITVNYEKRGSKYYLSGISSKKELFLENEENVKIESQFLPVKINVSVPDIIKGRDYYEDEKYVKEFWDRFSLHFEGIE